MSYTSPITTLPQVLRQPIGIAVLASLGFHGLLWATLPRLHAFSKLEADQQQRTVGLVELTPAEQNRLPQAATSETNTSQVTLPPFAMQPSVLPPMPPPLPSGLLTPSLSFPLGETPLYNYPIRISPRSQALRVPVYASPQNQQLVPPLKPNSRRLPYKIDKGAKKFKPYSRILDGIKPDSPDEVISSILNNPNITSPQSSKSPSASPSTSPSASPSQQAMSDKVSTNTSYGDGAGNLGKTLASADVKEWKHLRISPVYPKAACLNKAAGLAVATVEISSTGQKIAPHLEKSTGSAILDRVALIETGQYSAFQPGYGYIVGIDYKYNNDICSSTKNYKN